jgi:N-acetylglucosamine-6-sulfatase
VGSQRGRRVSCALLLLGALVFTSVANAQPNVVLIVTDDQRFDTVELMPVVESELVAKGVSFPRAFVVNPLCCPSRASILTGRWSHSTGVWSNGSRGDPYGGAGAFDPSSTLATWLDAAGYETMLAGKYLNSYNNHFPIVPPGWDRWFAFRSSPRYFNYVVTNGTAMLPFEEAPGDYSTDVLADEAVSFVREATGPFFLYFVPFAPHVSERLSAEPAPRHEGRYAGAVAAPASIAVNEADMSDKPRYLQNREKLPEDGLAELRQDQAETLLAVDDAIARILSALQASAKLADTLVLFTSDNGYLWGEHRLANKGVPYEEALRVPLVMRWDARGLAGIDRRIALNVDLAPTIADAVGIRAPKAEGRSLFSDNRRDGFLFEGYDPPWPPAYCGYRERWKYVQYRTGEEELYDLRQDPFERLSLARRPQYRAIVMGYRARVARSRCDPPGFQPLPACSRSGSVGSDLIRGTRWRDWICAGRGADVVRVRGGGRDVVRCGPGRDVARVDRTDVVRSGCESVRARLDAGISPQSSRLLHEAAERGALP